MAAKILNSSIISQARDQVSADLQGSFAILGLKKGAYYGLDESVGARVWQLISEPKSVDQILATLLDEYEVDFDRCHSDLISLLERMHQEGLIEIKSR